MRFLVDTNRIIAALIRDSVSRRIIFHFNAELITISLAEEEIRKHKEEIITKAKVSEAEFDEIYHQLFERLTILNQDAVKRYRDKARAIMDPIDPDDTQFIAAALATNAEIWSDDHHFQQQKKIKIWRTKDVVQFIEKS